MSKKSKSQAEDTAVEDEDVEEVEEETEKEIVQLGRCYTYNGEHYGPGEVEVDVETAKVLKKRERQLNRHYQNVSTTRRRDGATTGVVAKGTDPEIDNGPDESEAEEMFTFGDEQKKASELWPLSDKKLKRGGLRSKDVRRIRELESEQADTGEDTEQTDDQREDEKTDQE